MARLPTLSSNRSPYLRAFGGANQILHLQHSARHGLSVMRERRTRARDIYTPPYSRMRDLSPGELVAGVLEESQSWHECGRGGPGAYYSVGERRITKGAVSFL